MKTHTIGIIMNGVTGRMGTNQHLIRSICAIREQGGVQVGPGETIFPEPVLVGRNADKLKSLCERTGISKWTTDVDEVLGDENYPIYFDAQTTNRRFPAVKNRLGSRQTHLLRKTRGGKLGPST